MRSPQDAHRAALAVLVVCLCLVSIDAQAQEPSDDGFDRWRLDGGLTFSHFEQQIEVEIGGARGERLVSVAWTSQASHGRGGMHVGESRRHGRAARLGLVALLALLAWPACRCQPPARQRASTPAAETEPAPRPLVMPADVTSVAPSEPAVVGALHRDLDVRGVIHVSGTGTDAVTALASVEDSESLVAGVVFDGELTFAGQRWQSAGGRDGLALRLGRDGALRWSASLGGGGDTDIAAAAAGRAGDLAVVAGHFTGTLTVGERSLSAVGDEDGFAVAFDRDSGAVRWAVQLGGGGSDAVTSAVVVDTGQICLGGYGEGGFEVAGRPLSGAGLSGFVACLSTDGEVLGALRIGAEGSARVTSLATVPGTAGVVAGGVFTGALVAPDGTRHEPAGRGDTFVLRTTIDARVPWLRTFGSDGRERLTASAVREDGAIALGGSFSGALLLEEVRVESGPQRNGFIGVLDASGAQPWLTALVAEQPGEVAVLLPAGERGLIALGTFQGELELAGGMMGSAAGSIDAYALRLDAEGSVEAAAWLGGAGHETVSDAIWLDEQVLVLGGNFSGEAVLGFDTLGAQGDGDGWIAFVRAPRAW